MARLEQEKAQELRSPFRCQPCHRTGSQAVQTASYIKRQLVDNETGNAGETPTHLLGLGAY